MQKILIATHNFGKYKELMEVLAPLSGVKFVSLNDERIEDDVEENGDSFEANAIIKAEFFSRLTGLPAIADDSGIHVDALNGELGVKTRRWGAGAEASDAEWLAHFLDRMTDEENRRAEFVACIAFAHTGAETLTFRGECVGQILDSPKTEIEHGIPLSSVFLPEGKDKVYSAMGKNEKNAISHRGVAIKQCHKYLLEKFIML